jgi:hypothetical protein
MIGRYLFNILYISFLILLIVLFRDSPEKITPVLFIFTLFIFLTGISNNPLLLTIFFLFVLLPFNITLQIPQTLSLLGNTYSLYEPYSLGLWVNYLVPTISILDVFVFIFLFQVFNLNRKLFKKYFLNKYIIIFLLLLVIHTIFVQEINTALLSLRMYGYFLTAVLVKEFILSEKNIKVLLSKGYINILLLLMISLQGTLGIYQFLRGASFGMFYLGESRIASGMYGSSFIDIHGESFLRAYGTFPHPNILAGWFFMMLILTILLYTISKKKIGLIAIPLILFFSIFTFSRVIILLLLLISLIFVYTHFIKKSNALSISSVLWIRFINIFSGEDHSLEDRIELLRVNIQILRENLLLGTGLGNSLKAYTDVIPITQGGKILLQPVHNIWILSLLELGLLLGIYYFFLLYLFLLKNMKFNLLSIGVLVAIFIIGFFDHYFFTLPQGIVIFYSLLLLTAGLKL